MEYVGEVMEDVWDVMEDFIVEVAEASFRISGGELTRFVTLSGKWQSKSDFLSCSTGMTIIRALAYNVQPSIRERKSTL